jgi:glycosidase
VTTQPLAVDTTHPNSRPPLWVQDAVFYQIFPDRFANGDPTLDPEGVDLWSSKPTRSNYFGGDLSGIETHLDHLEDLGANAIYLTPIFEADRAHRYDTADYMRIDHRLGDTKSFQRLLGAAHARGIRVVLDGVFNHCGEGHWAFRHVHAHGAASRYADWFRVEAFPMVRDPVPNYATCLDCKYLPQFNHDNNEAREYLLGVAEHWTSLGIDGWRLDVPFLVPFGFWREFRRRVKALNPDLYVVAEVWETATEWLKGDTADGAMNYPLRELILNFASTRSTSSEFAEGVTSLYHLLPKQSHTSMLNLLGSHDTERLLTHLNNNVDAVKVASALLLTSPGPPMIYYADEIGTHGANDPDCRSPMQWDRSAWNGDLFECHRQLIAARRKHPALRVGDDELVPVSERVLMRRRTTRSETVTLIVNASDANAEVDRSLFPNASLVILGRKDLFDSHVEFVTLQPWDILLTVG